jgi:hypothetical protein
MIIKDFLHLNENFIKTIIKRHCPAGGCFPPALMKKTAFRPGGATPQQFIGIDACLKKV